MPKRIVRDVFGELLETGKQTVKAGKKAAGGVAKQTVKTVAGHKPKVGGDTGGDGGLDWLEKDVPASAQGHKVSLSQDDKLRQQQIKKLKEIDKKQSRQAYEQIQEQIRLIQKQKASQPRKYVTGKAGFDEEQVKSPETFWEKMKKKKEEAKNKFLPWTSKKGMGTGEIRRGVSG